MEFALLTRIGCCIFCAPFKSYVQQVLECIATALIYAYLSSPRFFASRMKNLDSCSDDYSTTTLEELVGLLRHQASAQSGLEHMMSKLLSTTLLGVAVVQNDQFLFANPMLQQMLDSAEGVLRQSVPFSSLRLLPYALPSCAGNTEKVATSQIDVHYECRWQTPKGKLLDVDIYAVVVPWGESKATIVLVNDISVRKQYEASARLAGLVYETTSEAIVVTDEDGVVVDANPAFSAITGYTLEEVLGQRLNMLASGKQSPQFYQKMWAELAESGQWQGDIWNRRKNGEEYAERLHISTSWNPDGSVYRRIGVFSDITSHKKREALVWRQANYDHLTNLPNRQRFHGRLHEAMQQSIQKGSPFALIFLDLDMFKDVNDTLGHNVGDELLKEVGRRLQTCVRDSDAVARLGGDEFTVIVSGVEDLSVVERICQQILGTLAKPYKLGEEVAMISASLGVTMYPADANDAGELLKNADMAMYAAKECGRNQYCFFLPAMREAVQARVQFSRDLHIALAENQFRLYYQPIIDVQTGKVCKAEALIRWLHPELGLVPPSEFIPFAEDSGLIVEIGNWVFNAAVDQAVKWRSFGKDFQISVNVSPAQFYANGVNPKDWLQRIEDAGLDMSSIVIEITERLLLDTNANVTKILRVFRDAGIAIALDDFGTGFSSLTYLKRYPINFIKIDQSFVRNIEPGSEDQALCDAMIVMAHKLGMEVIAEGVSAEVQLSLLQDAGCDYLQGFLFCPPVPAEQFQTWMQNWRYPETPALSNK